MSEHYYTQNPSVEHDEQQVIYEVLGNRFTCTTAGQTYVLEKSVRVANVDVLFEDAFEGAAAEGWAM